jgi:hypothetical protein
MISFGVNYYLSGLHSDAAGNFLAIPIFIYVLLVVAVLVSFLAYYRKKKFVLNNK